MPPASPWHGLRRLAGERDADVIVCGSRGLGPFSRAAVGSTSSGLLHHADRPVLVVPEGGGGLTGPVIVAATTDPSGPAAAVTRSPPRCSRTAGRVVVNVWESLVQHSLGGRALASGADRVRPDDVRGAGRRAFDAIATDIAEQGASLTHCGRTPRSRGPSRRRAPPGTGCSPQREPKARR